MKEDECREFLHTLVAIGVPHQTEARPFYFYGLLLEVTEQYAKIRMENGYKVIPLDEILEIHETKGA
jgi:hypothetical protein